VISLYKQGFSYASVSNNPKVLCGDLDAAAQIRNDGDMFYRPTSSLLKGAIVVAPWSNLCSKLLLHSKL
jgi:hypothetical protein